MEFESVDASESAAGESSSLGGTAGGGGALRPHPAANSAIAQRTPVAVRRRGGRTIPRKSLVIMNTDPVVVKTDARVFQIRQRHMAFDASLLGRNGACNVGGGIFEVAAHAILHVLGFRDCPDRLVGIVTRCALQRAIGLEETLASHQADGLKTDEVIRILTQQFW